VAIAHAQTAIARPTDPAAIAHFNRGNAHYKVRDFAKAVEEYKAGELIQAAAIFDYNLGQCYRQLARYEDAIWHYDRFLHSGFATLQDTAAIQNWISQMRAEMEQRAKSTPPTEPATMQPQPPSPPPQQLPPPHVVAPWYGDTFGWALAGSGLAIAGVGFGLDVSASGLRDDANRTPNQQEQNALRDKADSRALAGTILAIGGGALLVTGIVKLAIHDHESATPTTASIGVSPSGVFVLGRF
jgi:tetratricopeptide (TPR) repeat protein